MLLHLVFTSKKVYALKIEIPWRILKHIFLQRQFILSDNYVSWTIKLLNISNKFGLIFLALAAGNLITLDLYCSCVGSNQSMSDVKVASRKRRKQALYNFETKCVYLFAKYVNIKEINGAASELMTRYFDIFV